MRIHLVPFALLTVGVAFVSYPKLASQKTRFDENDQRVRMTTTIQTTTVVRAALTNKRLSSTMPRTPLRVVGAVNSRHTTPPPRDEIPSSSNVFLTNTRKPRRYNKGRKKCSKKMAIEEGSEDVVLVDVTSSSVDEFILSPPDSEIITEDINELQKEI